MMSTIKIQNQHTFETYLSTGINLFLGSGFSVKSKNSEGIELPAGDALRQEILHYFDISHYASLNLGQISSILENTQKERYYEFLAKRFRVEYFDIDYMSLLKININSVITTNIDNLFHKIVESEGSRYVNDITISGPAFFDRFAVDYIPLHGCVEHEPYDFVFSILDIAASFSEDQDKWRFLTERIQQKPTLFWGYGLNDAGVLQSLSKSTIKNREHKDKWVVLMNEDESTIAYLESLGFQIIIADTSSLLSYFSRLNIKNLSGERLLSTSKALFPEYAVPSLGGVPTRPISDFFRGAPPNWYDIFSNKVYKLSHLNKIKDSVNSGNHTVVVGLPGSGKSTMMMQIASQIDFKGYKILCNGLSIGQLGAICKKVGSEPILIFIDNIGDEFGVVDEIYNHPNIRFVGFDRSYNIELVSHRIKRSITNVCDVNSLNDADMQGIYSSIPQSLKGRTLIRPKMEANMRPSLWEFLVENIKGYSSKKKISRMLLDIKKESIDKYDLLLMCCYVHYCRTPVSYDLVYAYIRDKIQKYEDVYDYIDSLGELIAEVPLAMIDMDDQDYYVPRSTILSEGIISACEKDDLRGVIDRFHSDVSTYRIPKYNIFKRRAYDANLIGKAFGDWRDGLNFYEKASYRDSSAFLKQQCAIYLLRKKKYKEAFKWIDTALSQSDEKFFAIRNTHAVVLFCANIDTPHDATSLDSIRKSMEILSECYASDKKKLYHALVYADHAMKYAKIFNDNYSKEYIEKSKIWLKEEMEKVPWHREGSRMLFELAKY